MSRSVTFWNRLEPRPSDGTVGRALAAEIRDPLWLLARQWQLGEFRGEDAASPRHVEITTASVIDAAWSATLGAAGVAPERRLLASDVFGEWFPAAPIERALEGEACGDADDLSLAVELGQFFEALLREGLAPDLAARVGSAVRAGFALPAPDAPELDAVARRFLRVCGGRAANGTQVFLTAVARSFWTKVELPLAAPDVAAVDRLLLDYVARVREVWGDLDLTAPPAWRGEALRYDARVVDASHPAALALRAHPGREGDLDWYHFDAAAPPGTFTGAVWTREFIPGHVRFRGMPNARWWDFDSSQSDFGAMTLDRRDLGRLAVMEFMLSQGNDWFMIPYAMHVGTACQVTRLRVHDVFGGVTDVPRADALWPGWSMYGTSRAGDAAGRPCDFFHLTASSSQSAQRGGTLEEIRWLRDEMANLAWAVPHTATDALGEGRPVGELEAPAAPAATSRAAPAEGEPTARYVVQTDVPSWWVPLVPTRPTGEHRVTLRVGSFVTSAQTFSPPRGRMFPHAVDEAEVPRVGVTLTRVRVASRWIDGSLHAWTQRVRTVGAGEGSSGLRFDALADRPPGSGETAPSARA
jgi:hypothetical protein